MHPFGDIGIGGVDGEDGAKCRERRGPVTRLGGDDALLIEAFQRKQGHGGSGGRGGLGIDELLGGGSETGSLGDGV